MPDDIHFQWQNEFLLRTIYPMRSTKLRDFLVYFYEVDLWAEYKNKSARYEVKRGFTYRTAQMGRYAYTVTISKTHSPPDVSEQYRQAYPSSSLPSCRDQPVPSISPATAR
jgi:hypothetical protein